MNTRRWQDWVILIAGVWLLCSPFWMAAYSEAGGAALNSVIVGMLLIAASSIALARPRPWEEWVNLLLGAWLVVAPFALAFEDVRAATLNHIVIGIIVAGDSMIALMRTRSDRLGAAQHR